MEDPIRTYLVVSEALKVITNAHQIGTVKSYISAYNEEVVSEIPSGESDESSDEEMDENTDGYNSRSVSWRADGRSRIHKAIVLLYKDKIFSVGGSIPSPIGTGNLFEELFIDHENERISLGTILSPNIGAMIRVAKPSPFGDLNTQQTVFDPNVRIASEIPWSLIKNSKGESYDDQNLHGFLKQIKSYIEHQFVSAIQFEPLKINIYQEGGFFSSHVDTPVDPKKMFGSFVLSLPSKHDGGELVVYHQDEKHVFDFSKRSDILNWAAFYSDCVHQVNPVLSGTRITITFSMKKVLSYFKSGGLGSTVESITHSPNSHLTVHDFQQEIQNVFENHQPKTFGVLLTHKYTLDGLEAKILKGSDKILYDTLLKYRECELLSVVHKFHRTHEYDEPKLDDKKNVYIFDKDEIKFLLNKKPQVERNPRLNNIPFIDTRGGQILKHKYQMMAEYTGNESAPEKISTIYLHAAIIVHAQ